MNIIKSSASYKAHSGKHCLTISLGNMKTGAIPAISLPPIKTCRKNAPCRTSCYAMKAWRAYPTAKAAWDGNLKFFKKDPAKFEEAIDKILVKLTPKFFRWHVAGDIPSQEYFTIVKKIAKKHNKTKFLIFTKQYEFNYTRAPKNLVVVFSAWPGLKMPRHRKSIAFMRDKKSPDNRIKNTIECPGNCETCGACWSLSKLNKNVVFDKH